MSNHKSSHFPTAAVHIARVRADGPPAVRERRIADDANAERSSSNRGANGQHLSVLLFVKECLPKLHGESGAAIKLQVVTEDAVMEQGVDGADLLHRDCVLEVVSEGLLESDLGRLRRLARSLVRQLSESAPSVDETAMDLAPGFLREHLTTTFSPDSDSADKALMPLLGRPIAKSFCLKVPGLEDLPMSGKFLSAPEGVDPATERVFKGRIGGGSFLLKKKRELVLLVDAPKGSKKKQEYVPIEYHDNAHETMVYPLLRYPEQIVYLRVKSSIVRRGNGTTSNPYELVQVLTADVAERAIAGVASIQGSAQGSCSDASPRPPDAGNLEGLGPLNTIQLGGQDANDWWSSFSVAPYGARRHGHPSEESLPRPEASWPGNSPSVAAASRVNSQPMSD